MADCPKCNKHLKLSDWKQNCPYCGANVVVYDLQERLMKEADKAEVQYYYFQMKVDRLKAAFIGSKLSVVRIFTSLLPIAALFLPIVKVKLSAPLPEHSGNLGILDIYNMLENLNLGAIGALIGNKQTSAAAVLFTLSIAFLLLSVVVMLVHFLCLMISYSKHGKKRSYILDILFIILPVLSMIMFVAMPKNSFASGTLGIGSLIYVLLTVLNFVTDILVYRENIEIKHAQCYVGGIPIEEYFRMVDEGTSPEELRAEMYRRLMKIQQEQEEKLKEKAEEKEEK